MRVKGLDGKYVDLNPGDAIPGAENWPNPHLWAKRGHIARIDGKPVEAMKGGPYEPPREATIEDFKRGQNATASGPRFPGAAAEDIGPGKGKTPAIRDPSEEEMGEVKHEASKIDPKELEALQERSRKELLKLAEQKGLKLNGSEPKDIIARSILSNG
jgi:hypothetical protein